MGLNECTACVAGEMDDDFDPATPCVPCAIGQFSPGGSTSCSDCAAGLADLDSNPATPCTDCEAGHYAEDADCVPCALGTYDDDSSSATPCISCNVGTLPLHAHFVRLAGSNAKGALRKLKPANRATTCFNNDFVLDSCHHICVNGAVKTL